MTWTYDPTTGDVSDHTDAVVTTLSPPVTVPDDILDLMQEEAMAAGVANGLSERQIEVISDAVFEDITIREESG